MYKGFVVFVFIMSVFFFFFPLVFFFSFFLSKHGGR